jgi:UDP-glucuronate 4-epimerase
VSEHVLVTGALGCIGAWVVRNLILDGSAVTVFDLANNPHRLRLIMDDDQLAKVNFVEGDITDTERVVDVVSGVTHIIHLAALQVPFCRADPVLGARVNVVGTVNIFEAAKRAGVPHIVFASSVAVFGRSDEYDDAPIPDDAPLNPRTHYGVYKQANEGTARIYWEDNGVSSIGLRPYTVYGPGRDQGFTADPTKAMLAAAAGRPFHIGFGGRCAYQYADDVARLFIQSARVGYQGAGTFNLGGSFATMPEVIAAIEAAAPEMAGQITFDDKALPFPEETDDSGLAEVIGNLKYTSLQEGVGQTVAHFRQSLQNGRIQVE